MAYTDNKNMEISDHLQKLLKDKNHQIILSVPIESCHLNRKRHLVVISAPADRQKPLKHESVGSITPSRSQSFICNSGNLISSPGYIKTARNRGVSEQQFCILGVDTFQDEGRDMFRLGFVFNLLWGTKISLDGDGGFGIHILAKHYMFKPISLQSLWTTIQSLHAITTRLKPRRTNSQATDLVSDYQNSINSPQSCINEWNKMPDILSRRPVLVDELTIVSDAMANIEHKKTVIRSRLREIMKTVDLDEITSKSIRLKLEEDLNQKLEEFKSYIDEEILIILGQMDPSSKIFDFLYLGSEWNASNLEELNANGITHIMNITREIDNFFPAVFKYQNIREYDVEETDLLKHWDETFNFVLDCIQTKGKVLIHCKMGISRSASTVCAFAMKYYGWSLKQSLNYTKERRAIINPNKGFRHQLAVYEGILRASRQRKSFRRSYRSKSESYLERKDASIDDEHGENKIDEINNIERVHHYAELAKYFQNLQHRPNSNDMKSMYSDSENNPPKKADTYLDETKQRKSPPSPSHCNRYLELELSALEQPEAPLDNRILQNRINIPLNVQRTQSWRKSRSYCNEMQDINQNVENIRNINMTEAILPELSVKTLTDMFDHRLVDNIKENKMKRPAENYTEC